ncbi:MAG: potassium channel family protein [Anaerolineales bacterium]
MPYHPVFFILGLALLLILAFDLFITIVQGNEGPASRAAQSAIQRLLLKLHHMTGQRRFLIWSSSMLILSLVFIWITLLYGGWWLMFMADEQAIIHSSDELPADPVERIYFTGFTISTLGVGDYVPQGHPWQFMTTLAALTGFFFVTFIISFLVSVTQKQELRRKLALHIHHLGKTPQDMILQHWDKDKGRIEGTGLDVVLPDLVEFEQQHLEQPILNRFHGASQQTSAELALVILDETLTLAEMVVQPPLAPHFQHTRNAISNYLASQEDLEADHVDPPPPPDLSALRASDIPLHDEATIQEAYAGLAKRRRKLRALVASTGWDWPAVVSRDERS